MHDFVISDEKAASTGVSCPVIKVASVGQDLCAASFSSIQRRFPVAAKISIGVRSVYLIGVFDDDMRQEVDAAVFGFLLGAGVK